jgi:hypothetical protein
MGAMRNAYKSFLGELEGMRSIEMPIYRWEENIQMDLDITEGSMLELRVFETRMLKNGYKRDEVTGGGRE